MRSAAAILGHPVTVAETEKLFGVDLHTKEKLLSHRDTLAIVKDVARIFLVAYYHREMDGLTAEDLILDFDIEAAGRGIVNEQALALHRATIRAGVKAADARIPIEQAAKKWIQLVNEHGGRVESDQ